jgi:hypothetical protein
MAASPSPAIFLFLRRDHGETIHHGRHTFISHALAGGRTLAEVRDAAGRANVSITSAYLHVAVEDGEVGNCSHDRCNDLMDRQLPLAGN